MSSLCYAAVMVCCSYAMPLLCYAVVMLCRCYAVPLLCYIVVMLRRCYVTPLPSYTLCLGYYYIARCYTVTSSIVQYSAVAMLFPLPYKVNIKVIPCHVISEPVMRYVLYHLE